MRLDKYLSEAAAASRSEAAKAAKNGKITVNGVCQKSAAVHIDAESAEVYYCGKKVVWKKYTYIMLNKPAGFVSSTDEGGHTVMELLPSECTKKRMFPCGRLDIDTTGLLLITNDGPLAHELLAPRHHVAKSYRFTCFPYIGEAERERLENGVDIGHFITAPAEVTLDDGGSGVITITEGKFHQIKRMFHGVGSEITSLKRISFGSLTLDSSLAEGEWRYLTDEEENSLKSANA